MKTKPSAAADAGEGVLTPGAAEELFAGDESYAVRLEVRLKALLLIRRIAVLHEVLQRFRSAGANADDGLDSVIAELQRLSRRCGEIGVSTDVNAWQALDSPEMRIVLAEQYLIEQVQEHTALGKLYFDTIQATPADEAMQAVYTELRKHVERFIALRAGQQLGIDSEATQGYRGVRTDAGMPSVVERKIRTAPEVAKDNGPGAGGVNLLVEAVRVGAVGIDAEGAERVIAVHKRLQQDPSTTNENLMADLGITENQAKLARAASDKVRHHNEQQKDYDQEPAHLRASAKWQRVKRQNKGASPQR